MLTSPAFALKAVYFKYIFFYLLRLVTYIYFRTKFKQYILPVSAG